MSTNFDTPRGALWDDATAPSFSDSHYAPSTVRGLLKFLDVSDAPRTTQQDAVDGWLEDNEASAVLALGLHREGFIT